MTKEAFKKHLKASGIVCDVDDVWSKVKGKK